MSPDHDPTARFARQQALPGYGEAGLPRLARARVHVVGAGPLAGPALLSLARAGVGTLYVDDGADVDPWDAGGWLYAPGDQGRSRMLAAIEVVRASCAAVVVRPFATDTRPTATAVCSGNEAVARTAAERARLAGLPHVVAVGDAAGGEVVTIPVGAPCFACAARPGARAQPTGGAASALASLAALELLQLLIGLGTGQPNGRRVLLQGGRPRAEATARRPGCQCQAG